MKIVLATMLCYLLLGLVLSNASIATATTGVIPAVPSAIPGVVPVATSHQFVTRNWNRPYVPLTTVATYPNTYIKSSSGYPTYPTYPTYNYPAYNYPYATTYQYAYPYYYPTYNYGYGYKGVW
ncbi:uncharacterized protein LOC108043416 [Drosophila rhopaloa]|uniref:Uncharacterized protein LOC108043416 n=1 Tax=Drosophila rhopaloa TaxID=1041015 RepID=A0A6P4EWZ6_DRORH|nr:uncharacterized protein LOC108043416 [Drosophila rhopaloa]